MLAQSFLKLKRHYKPFYKQFLRLRENAQNRKKLLKFKRKKWEKLIKHCTKKLKIYKKFNPTDPTSHVVTRFASKGNAAKKGYRNGLNSAKILRLYYGNLSRKFFKKQIKKLFTKKDTKNFNLTFLELFETRLDTILYKAKFSSSLRNSRQLILHRKVLVNNQQIRTPSYVLKQNDIIQINPKYYYLIERNLKNLQVLPIPPDYITVNYKTLEIRLNSFKHSKLSTCFPFFLKLENILILYRRQ